MPSNESRSTRGGRVPARLAVTLGIVVALLVVIRAALDPLAARSMHRALAAGQTFRGDFGWVHVSIFPPAFEIAKLKIIEHPQGSWRDPLCYVERARASLQWRQMLRGRLVTDVAIESPKVSLKVRREEPARQKAGNIGDQLEALPPLRVARLTVKRGELLVTRVVQGKLPTIWLHDADLVAENLTTRKALAQGRAAHLAGQARVQHSGKLRLDFTVDPWARGLTFAGKTSLRDLDVRELSAFIAAETDLTATKGTVDLFAEIRARDGAIDGGVEPVFKDLELGPAGKGLGDRLKAALADAAVHLASNKESGQRKVATVIPIRGTVSDPHAQTVPSILGVVRNAFVQGLAEGFENLPPPTASKKEGLLKQTRDALEKGQGPPKAQPEPSPHAGEAGRP